MNFYKRNTLQLHLYRIDKMTEVAMCYLYAIWV